MRAALFRGVGLPLAIEQVDDPEPAPGEVVVRVGRCGICGSDLHMAEGHAIGFRPGDIPGHEYAGEVVALGAGVERLAVGDRIAAMPLSGCGRCLDCLDGFPAFCARMRMRGSAMEPGGYGEYALASAAFSVKLPEGLGMDDGALVEPLAIAARGVRRARLAPGGRALVIGAGPIGLATAFWARRSGARRIVVAARTRRREPLAAAIGADAFLTSNVEGGLPLAAAQALGGAPDHVFECAGMPGMIELAIACAGRRALVSVLGLCNTAESITPVMALTKEIDLRFSFFYSLDEYHVAVDALDAGAVESRAMITRTIGLDDLPTAFAELMQGAADCKVMIDPWAKGRIAA